jgi:hypothetical protein
MADGEEAGETGQQHQPQADDAVDQDEGELGQQVFRQQPRRCQQPQAQQPVPEDMAAVLGELDVLAVVGLEMKRRKRI